jgi:hypothetical protein
VRFWFWCDPRIRSAGLSSTNQNVLFCPWRPTVQFPAAGNLAANFFSQSPEFCKFCPKSADLGSHAGKGAGNPGNLPVTASGNTTYDLFCGNRQEPSREIAGNTGPDRGVRLFPQGPRRPPVARITPNLTPR